MKLCVVLAVTLVLVHCGDAFFRSTCDMDCSLNAYPICGRNTHGELTTFTNECAMTVFNCENNEDYRKMYNGDCLGRPPRPSDNE